MLGITLKETRVYREIKEEGRELGREEGREQGERSLILRQLTRRVGELPTDVRSRIETLSLEQLENLGEALLVLSQPKIAGLRQAGGVGEVAEAGGE